ARRVRGDPDREPDAAADADQPGEHAVTDRSEAAHAEAADRTLRALLGELQERDDVALLLGLEDLVGEDRHLLRAGQHGLIDVPLLDAGERGGVATARQRTAGPGEVVARGAVRAEELGAATYLLLRAVGDVGVALVGDGGAGAERGDVGRQRAGLLLAVDRRLARGLRGRVRHRHPAGADLEVDRG